MNRRAFLVTAGKALAVFAFPSTVAWASVNKEASDLIAFDRTHTEARKDAHASFSLHPKVQRRLDNWKKEIPYQFHRIYKTKLFRDFCLAEKVTGFSVEDQLTIALLETAIGENPSQMKNIAEIEDETFIESFRTLPSSFIDSISTYDPALGRRVRLLVPIDTDKGRGRYPRKGIGSQVLALRQYPFISMIVVAHHIFAEADEIVQSAKIRGSHPRFWHAESHFWTIHNSGGGMARQLVERKDEAAVKVMGANYLRQRGFPIEGTACDYHSNAYAFYCGIRTEFQKLLAEVGFRPQTASKAAPTTSHPFDMAIIPDERRRQLIGLNP